MQMAKLEISQGLWELVVGIARLTTFVADLTTVHSLLAACGFYGPDLMLHATLKVAACQKGRITQQKDFHVGSYRSFRACSYWSLGILKIFRGVKDLSSVLL